MLTDFQNSFTGRLVSKFALLNIPLSLEHVTALACEIVMSENQQQSETAIAINEKSQGGVAMHLRYGELFIDLPTAYLLQSLLMKEFFKSVNIWQSYWQESGLSHTLCVPEHQPMPLLSWASALDLHNVSALGSRVGWTPGCNNERTNEHSWPWFGPPSASL